MFDDWSAGFVVRAVFGLVFIWTGEMTLRLLTFWWRPIAPMSIREWLEYGWDFDYGIRWLVGMLVWAALIAPFALGS